MVTRQTLAITMDPLSGKQPMEEMSTEGFT